MTATAESQARIGPMHSLSTLRIRETTLSPIHRLPPELLVNIFMHYAHGHHSNPDSLTEYIPGWVFVSYICRYWRSVALNCPTLWSHHFVVSLRWTKELLARSHRAPLKIRIAHSYPKLGLQWSRLVEELMNHAERIQELHLDLPDSCMDEILPKLSSSAPLLQILTISVHDYAPEWSSAIFCGDTPVLRTLELSYCGVPWNSFKLSAVTTLGLHWVPGQNQRNIEEFLTALGCMPDLQHLYLHDALVDADNFLNTATFSNFQKISLPHLSRLLIAEPCSTIIAVLSCVKIPLKTELRLSFGHLPYPGSAALLCSVLAQRFSTSGDQDHTVPTIRSLIIQYWEEVEFTFSTLERDCDSSISTSDHDWDRNIPLRITTCLDGLTREYEDRSIRDIFCSIPRTYIRSVHFVNPPFSSTLWRMLLRHLHEVRYIKLSGGNMPDLASTLSHTGDLTTHEDGDGDGDGEDGGDQHISHILVPALEELELDEITFLGERKLPWQIPAISRRRLFDVLATRDVPQGRLIMTRCAVGHPTLRVLDMVRSWDGLADVNEVPVGGGE